MHTLSITTPPDSMTVISARKTILFCLSDEEMDWFFPAFNSHGLNANVRRFNTTKTDRLEFWRTLHDVRPDVLVTCWSTPPLPESDGICWKPAYICHLSGSIRTLVPRSMLLNGVVASNWGTLAAVAVAEHALLLTLAAQRRMPRWTKLLKAPYEQHTELRIRLKTQSLTGKKIGLHGFGAIARHIVKLLKPFDVSISAYSEGVPASLMREHNVESCADLAELFRTSAVLIEVEALTPATTGIVSAELLELLPRDAIFVNVGRGKVVDEVALARLAADGRIRIAIDVYQEEPLSHASPLFDLEDAVLSPHIAGPTSDLFSKCAALAESNLRRFLNGDPVEAAISLSQYDRST